MRSVADEIRSIQSKAEAWKRRGLDSPLGAVLFQVRSWRGLQGNSEEDRLVPSRIARVLFRLDRSGLPSSLVASQVEPSEQPSAIRPRRL